MKMKYWKAWGAVCALMAGVPFGYASAAEENASQPEFELAGITVEAKRPDWESKLSPGSVTVIRPDEFKGEQKELPDLLKMVPGVHVREVNGKGQYTTVTVRGSTAAQVGIFIDGILTNLGGDAAVDISTIPVKNVERIEVYRGYIPSRFGGTFIGGVINIVTKRPTRAHIAAELGKASFGGKSGSLELVTPLKSGSLLLGLNYEAADGDFPYENYYAPNTLKDFEQGVASTERSLAQNQSVITDFNKNTIKEYLNEDALPLYVGGALITKEDVAPFYDTETGEMIDEDGWVEFVHNGGLAAALEGTTPARRDKLFRKKGKIADSADHKFCYDFLKDYTVEYTGNKVSVDEKGNVNIVQTDGTPEKMTLSEAVAYNYLSNTKNPRTRAKNYKNLVANGTSGNIYGVIQSQFNSYYSTTDTSKISASNFFKQYPQYGEDIISTIVNTTPADADIQSTNAHYESLADPNNSYAFKHAKTQIIIDKDQLERMKKGVEAAKDKERHRRYNDRKNVSSIIKWQNDNWMVKGSYSETSRHLPDSLWGVESTPFSGADSGVLADVIDYLWTESKKQNVKTYDFMVQNRQQNGRLEWGWTADYQHQKKKYRAEHKMFWPWDEEGNFVNWGNDAARNFWQYSVLRAWSQYTSNKYNAQIDGSYKLSDRQILEFQANYSYEKLGIKGSNMDIALSPEVSGLWGSWQTRNRYEQKIFNIQIQDTITLDKKESWFLTPSWRYNQSTIIGHSDAAHFYDKPDGSSQAYRWFHPRDSQKDGKGTWQIALKKIVNDHLTFRSTGGTYFRLLNMYEIAGDGAGIMPMPTHDWNNAVYPQPEYGKQFDFSAIWTGKALRSDAYATLTYFWRDTERMLQLRRKAKDFWCYTNDSRGTIHGFELQTGLKWEHFSLDLEGTYTNIHAEQKISSQIPGGSGRWYEARATYQPEWEGNLRLSWFPNPKFTLFGEAHYIGSYYTLDGADRGVGGEDMGYPTPGVTVLNTGIKLKPSPRWQLVLGCNDIFDKQAKMRISLQDGTYVNPEFPIQGRTYYGSIRYEF